MPYYIRIMWVDIVVIIILCLSLFGGLKEGAVKQFFSLLILFIAIPLTGQLYYLLATALSFIPGTNWENFIGFFITLAIISVIFHFIFLIPRNFTAKVWKKGLVFRILGGAFNAFGACIGFAVFTLVLGAYPVIDFAARAVADSGVLMWLAEHLSFVQAMLPEVFRNAAGLVVACGN